MQKRTKLAIEADVIRIKAAAETATSFRQIARMTDLSESQVHTSLQNHPVIRKRILEKFDENKPTKPAKAKIEKKPGVTICDAPALLHGLKYCVEDSDHIVIPLFVCNIIQNLSLLQNDPETSEKAKRAIDKLREIGGKVAKRLESDDVPVMPEGDVSWKAKAFVALANIYHEHGYSVTIKTRTAEFFKLAKLQEKFNCVFVPVDKAVSVTIV